MTASVPFIFLFPFFSAWYFWFNLVGFLVFLVFWGVFLFFFFLFLFLVWFDLAALGMESRILSGLARLCHIPSLLLSCPKSVGWSAAVSESSHIVMMTPSLRGHYLPCSRRHSILTWGFLTLCLFQISFRPSLP